MSEMCLSFIYLHTCQVLGYLPHRIISTSTPTITTTLFTSQQNLLTDNWFNQPRPSSQFTGNKLNTTNISHAMWEMKKNYHKHIELLAFKTLGIWSAFATSKPFWLVLFLQKLIISGWLITLTLWQLVLA